MSIYLIMLENLLKLFLKKKNEYSLIYGNMSLNTNDGIV